MCECVYAICTYTHTLIYIYIHINYYQLINIIEVWLILLNTIDNNVSISVIICININIHISITSGYTYMEIDKGS